jgi:hypothetical protein
MLGSGVGLERQMASAARLKWFVTYDPLARGPEKYRRLTETFPDELAAKVFAKARLADARRIVAGTINPYAPKRVIGSAQLLDWLNEA